MIDIVLETQTYHFEQEEENRIGLPSSWSREEVMTFKILLECGKYRSSAHSRIYVSAMQAGLEDEAEEKMHKANASRTSRPLIIFFFLPLISAIRGEEEENF